MKDSIFILSTEFPLCQNFISLSALKVPYHCPVNQLHTLIIHSFKTCSDNQLEVRYIFSERKSIRAQECKLNFSHSSVEVNFDINLPFIIKSSLLLSSGATGLLIRTLTDFTFNCITSRYQHFFLCLNFVKVFCNFLQSRTFCDKEAFQKILQPSKYQISLYLQTEIDPHYI